MLCLLQQYFVPGLPNPTKRYIYVHYSSFLSSVFSSVSSVVCSSVVSSSSSASDIPPLGAAIVATVKSRSVIVGVQFSGKLIELICMVSPTFSPSKSTVIFSGIAVAGQFNSTCDLTTVSYTHLTLPTILLV